MTADKTFVQRGLDKGSSVTVWGRSDYLHEKSRQLEVQNIYEDVKFSENILTNLAEKPMKNLNVCVAINWFQYFTNNFKKATNLAGNYIFCLRYTNFSAVSGRPVTFNCSTPTENVSEYLDYILKPIMQDSWPYIRVSGDCLKKIKILVNF